MGGIDKMTEQILKDARSEAEEILNAAKKEAEDEKAKATQKETDRKEKAQASLEKELKDYRDRAESARDLSRRRKILEKKQEIISDFIGKTLSQLKNADDNSYFSMLYQMLERYVHSGDGQLYLNEKDIARKPADFDTKVQAIAEKAGGSVSVMSEPSSIEDGFMLVYGGTQENCTFEALIESERSMLQDEVNTMLWRDSDV